MIDIYVDDGILKVVGEIDMGYIGKYRDSQIEFIETLEEVREWDVITDNLSEDCSDEKVLECLKKICNEYIEKIGKNIKKINDIFLLKAFLDMEGCGNAFWEVSELVNPDKMPEDTDNIYKPYWDVMTELSDKYSEAPNDGSVEKEDIEKILRNNYPMFNMDAFINGIVPEIVCLHEDGISFQCSDNFGEVILCSAYDRLDENLCFTDWHNF